MNTQRLNVMSMLLALCVAASSAHAVTWITYQGRLQYGGSHVNELTDMIFQLWTASSGGETVGGPFAIPVEVNNGLFTVELPFGEYFLLHDQPWLEIQVFHPPDGMYVTLTPRQKVTPAPLAVRALNVGDSLWDAAVGGITYMDGNVGIGTNSPTQALHVVGRVLAQSATSPIHGVKTGGGESPGVLGETSSIAEHGSAILGRANNAASGLRTAGVWGRNFSTTNSGVGVRGSHESGGVGVYGHSNGTNLGIGVWGESAGANGLAGYFHATHPPVADSSSYGVYGHTEGAFGSAGVFGYASSSTGVTYGVNGYTESNSGAGVFGQTAFGTTSAWGVYGRTNGTSGRGVFGENTATSGFNSGIYGLAFSPNGNGVTGLNNATTGSANGVFGQTSSTSGTAISGLAAASSGSNRAIAGQTLSSTGYAGYFTGPVGSRNFFQRNVGIGTTNPGFLLHVNGDAAKPGGGSWSSTSDLRLKQNINDLHGSLNALLALRGVSFEYIDAEEIHELPGQRLGMIAQEVEEVFPDWIHEGEDGFKRLTYRGFEAVVVEAMRELREEKDAEIDALHDAMATMAAMHAAEVDSLRIQLDRLEAMIVSIAEVMKGAERAER
jgi:hypothetical protein